MTESELSPKTQKKEALGVVVNLTHYRDCEDWADWLVKLGSFLRKYDKADTQRLDDTVVHLIACEDCHIGGLRLIEITWTSHDGWRGATCFRADNPALFLLCEDFLATLTIKPRRPYGWASCLNPHGEARISLMRHLKVEEKLIAEEYRRQLAEEDTVEEEPEPLTRT